MERKKVKDNPIKQYYYKKKAQPNIVAKVALFACVNKFIRMIHSLCKNGLIYELIHLIHKNETGKRYRKEQAFCVSSLKMIEKRKFD